MVRWIAVGAAMAAILTASTPTFAQGNSPAPAVSPAQRNLADFDFVVAKIRSNYAGWDSKVTDANKRQLDDLTSRLRARAANATDEELLAVLTEWIGFFQDRHTIIVNNAPPAPGAGTAFPSTTLDERAVRAKLRALGRQRHPVEGVWDIAGTYRVGVLREGAAPSRFQAIVLSTTSQSWQPKQIKAELERKPDGTFAMLFRAGNHAESRTVAKLISGNGALLVENWAPWIREWPAPADPVALRRVVPPADLMMSRLSPKTLWLRIPDFGDNRRRPLLDLLAAHRKALETTPNLVIDLRNNGGGSDYVYEPLIPLLYTHPIVTVGMELRASPDNIKFREEVADRLRKDSPAEAAEIDAQNKMLRSRLGQYVQPEPQPFSIRTEKTVLPFPKRVAVLVDGAGSTGEQFLLLARQSRKTTLMGQRNSAGVLDFANVVRAPVPSRRYQLQWATSRSLRLPEYPVDPDGIAPDVRIPDTVADPVAYAAAWLERQVD